jgi:hypothetical protein
MPLSNTGATTAARDPWPCPSEGKSAPVPSFASGPMKVVPLTVMRVAAIAATLLCVGIRPPLANATVAPRTPIESWDGLRLGMTEQQVRAVQGFDWDERTAKDPTFGTAQHSLEARKRVQLFGLPAYLDVIFLADGTVGQIFLDTELGHNLPASRCKSAFFQLVRSAASVYGQFEPLQPAGPTAVPGATMRITTKNRRLSATSSAYSEILALDPTHYSSPRVTLVARRSSGPNVLDISTVWSGSGEATKCSSASLRIWRYR